MIKILRTHADALLNYPIISVIKSVRHQFIQLLHLELFFQRVKISEGFSNNGVSLSRCCGRESKLAKQKRKSKQSEQEIALFEQPKVDSYIGLSLAETLECHVSDVCTHFCRLVWVATNLY